jgi:hypothetical protein
MALNNNTLPGGYSSDAEAQTRTSKDISHAACTSNAED